MTKNDDRKLEALIRKNAAKAAKPNPKKDRRQFDDTLAPEDEADQDSRALFREMKKREF